MAFSVPTSSLLRVMLAIVSHATESGSSLGEFGYRNRSSSTLLKGHSFDQYSSNFHIQVSENCNMGRQNKGLVLHAKWNRKAWSSLQANPNPRGGGKGDWTKKVLSTQSLHPSIILNRRQGPLPYLAFLSASIPHTLTIGICQGTIKNKGYSVLCYNVPAACVNH